MNFTYYRTTRYQNLEKNKVGNFQNFREFPPEISGTADSRWTWLDLNSKSTIRPRGFVLRFYAHVTSP